MILNIELANFTLQYAILNTPVSRLWVERMALRNQWPLDDPLRFYGFRTQQEEEQVALEKINNCITLIKLQHPNIAVGYLEDVRDQDRLNYWHHIFETYHGLLEQEDRNNTLTPVLADLNVAVHRCESVARGNRPRFVCTWYGLPKTETLSTDMMQEYGTLNPRFGSVCLNYCEIGKTLEDLSFDNDKYISDEAFRPFSHYSADFNVRFYEETADWVSEKLTQIQHYYSTHEKFFLERGYKSFNDPRLLPLRFPVAELIETMPREDLINKVAQQQTIKQVWIE